MKEVRAISDDFAADAEAKVELLRRARHRAISAVMEDLNHDFAQQQGIRSQLVASLNNLIDQFGREISRQIETTAKSLTVLRQGLNLELRQLRDLVSETEEQIMTQSENECDRLEELLAMLVTHLK
jgi:uncharacterized protein Yka (UPF0111/DUF47 family)